MTRRVYLVAVAACVGCGRPARPLEDAFPAVVGGWRRVDASGLDLQQAPDLVRKMGLRQAARAVYQDSNDGRLRLNLYEMGSESTAFELVQKWKPEEGRMAFYRRNLFGVAEGADAPALSRFIGAFENAIK